LDVVWGCGMLIRPAAPCSREEFPQDNSGRVRTKNGQSLSKDGENPFRGCSMLMKQVKIPNPERKMNAATTTETLKNSGANSPAARSQQTAAVAPTSRQRFLDACQCRPVDRPPMWLMRQAGRALPEYRALKQKWSFLELVQTPERWGRVIVFARGAGSKWILR